MAPSAQGGGEWGVTQSFVYKTSLSNSDVMCLGVLSGQRGAERAAVLRRLVEDTAWHPVPKAEAEKWGATQSFVYKTFLGSPLKLWASVGHWLIWHFNLDLYTEKQKPRVRPRSCLWLVTIFTRVCCVCSTHSIVNER